MRLLFVADGRSPIALNWIRYFAERGDEVHLASTFRCAPGLPLASLEITPVAFSAGIGIGPGGDKRGSSGAAIRVRMAARHFLGPLTIAGAARRLRAFIKRVQPDLVHAMRIPYEGMLAADAYTGTPLLVSVWGNDFTLHAPANALMRHYTSWTLQVAHALHADCQRDIRLSRSLGLDPLKPILVVPGNGGVRTDVFFPPAALVEDPIVINPRGARAYVRNDVFFEAIPLVLAKRPDARFICASMAGEPQVSHWIRQLGVGHAVELLPPVAHTEMAAIFQRAQLMVSPGVHDGTPNTLLEAMACSCLPVAGNLESIREWITNGQNGLLADPNDPQSLADAILEGLENKNLRHQAAGLNRSLVMARADYARCMPEADRFYRRIVSRA